MPWRNLVASSPRLYRLVPVEPSEILPPGDYLIAGEAADAVPVHRFRLAAAAPIDALIQAYSAARRVIAAA